MAATGIGKITELIVNIGVPGGLVKIFLKQSMLVKQGRTRVYNKFQVEKARRFVQGAGAAGVAEGIFVGDVEDAGTFGDLIGGPTELDRDRR